jgi:hypothetical protein
MRSITAQAPIIESENADLTVADAVWVGAALLHEKRGEGPFSTEEIVKSVQDHHLTRGAYRSIWQHVNQHCVANRKAQPNRARMLTATGHGDRRLFRDGDRFDPERAGGRTCPDWAKLPAEYDYLRQWYQTIWNKPTAEEDPLLAAIGIGREIWADQHADEYVAELRDWRME